MIGTGVTSIVRELRPLAEQLAARKNGAALTTPTHAKPFQPNHYNPHTHNPQTNPATNRHNPTNNHNRSNVNVRYF